MIAPGRLLLIAATLAFPLLAAALTLAGLPLACLAFAIPVVYVALLVTGVMSPRLGMFASALCQGSPTRPEVSLTFDDGPDPATTPKILAALAKANARATFFVLGSKARQAPEVLRGIASAGHDIGIHGDTHDRLLSLRAPDAIAASLERALATVETVTGHRPTLFRPPVGHISPRTAQAARRLALTLVAWSARGRDGLASTTPEQVTHRVLAGVRPGAIVLLHDAAEHGDREPASIVALPVILDEISRRGLRCVTVSQLQRS